MNGLISIVVPVYNVEKYLDRCVSSLVNQNYYNKEIILVDDGSTDKSGELCEEWAKRYKCIRVIHQENIGLSGARNTGINAANGEFLMFVDSDDWMHRQALEFCMRFFEDDSIDIVEVQHVKTWKTEEHDREILSPQFVIVDRYDALKLNYDWKYCYSMAWGKVFRTSVVKDLNFPVGMQHEDEYYTYKAFYRSNRIVHIMDNMYYYFMRSDSITGTKWTMKKFDGVQAYLQRIQYFEELQETELVKAGKAHFVKFTFEFFDVLCKAKWMTFKERKELFLHHLSIISSLDLDDYFCCVSFADKIELNLKKEFKRIRLLSISKRLYMYSYYCYYWYKRTKRIAKEKRYFGE